MARVTQRDKVLDYFKDHPSARAQEIADYLGTSVNSARVLLFGLVQNHSITKLERGVYGFAENPAVDEMPQYKKDLLTARPQHGIVESKSPFVNATEETLALARAANPGTIILNYLKGKKSDYRATRHELLGLGVRNKDIKDAIKKGYLSQLKSDGSYHLTKKEPENTAVVEDHGFYLGTGRRLRF